MKMIQPACAALLLAAILSSCVSWVTVTTAGRPYPIPSFGAQVAETGLVVIVDQHFSAETLVSELREVAQITVREPIEDWRPGSPVWSPEAVEPVTVPTLRLTSEWYSTAVPPYVLTLFTLGIWPTRTPLEEIVLGQLLLPEQPPQFMFWSVKEPLFMWLPLLPLTPFWAVWRETSAGETPDVWKIAAQDLRAMLAGAAEDTR